MLFSRQLALRREARQFRAEKHNISHTRTLLCKRFYGLRRISGAQDVGVAPSVSPQSHVLSQLCHFHY